MLEQVIPKFQTDKLTDISIDGDTAVAFTENVEERFLAYGWQVLHVDHGDTLVRIDYQVIYLPDSQRPCWNSQRNR